MDTPKYGIEIDFIDNSTVTPYNTKQGPLAELSEGFMTDSIETMACHCEDMAIKLRAAAKEPPAIPQLYFDLSHKDARGN